MATKLNIDDFPENIQKQIRDQLCDRATVCTGKSKQDRQAALGETPGLSQLDSPVCIIVRCYRKGKQWDVDNLETKAIQDALVKIGIISDDRVMEVQRIIKEGHVVQSKEEEKTTIEVIEL